MRRYWAIMGVSWDSLAISENVRQDLIQHERKFPSRESNGQGSPFERRAEKKENSEAVAKEIGAPASGITATKWQVLTPRTKISNPVLGLERIASPSLKLAQTCQHTQAKLIHLFTII